MRSSVPIAIFVLIVISVPTAMSGRAAEYPYIDAVEEIIGDWIITENTTVINRTVVLQGNLLIRGGGLELINSTVILRCYADGQFRIEVKEGYIRIIGSRITADDPENRYYITIGAGGTLSAEDSVIEYSGYQDGERSGVYVLGKLEIENTTFRWNYCPLWVWKLKDTTLRNITLYRNSWGMRFLECRNVSVIGANITENYRNGIWMEGGEGNIITKSFINGIYLPSHNSIAQGIRIENESGDLISENRILRTSREGVFITGRVAQRNTVLNNTFIINGVAGIHLYETSNNTVKKNNLSGSYLSILLQKSDFNILNGNLVSSSIGMKLSSSFLNRILFGRFEDVERYGIMLYSSNRTIISGVEFDNVTKNIYMKDSVAIFGGHMYSDRYLIYGTSKLYLTTWVRVSAMDYEDKPINWVRLKLSFLGDEISKGVTYRDGTAGFLAPYAVHTADGKRYSWCEVEAESDRSFEENPIRFYSWESRSIVFREKAPGLDVSLSTDKKELVPGDTINITLEIYDSGKPVNNATIDLTIGGKPMFPPKRTGEGLYSMTLKVPEFENSLKIEAKVSAGNKMGVSSVTVMRPSVEYGEAVPAEEKRMSEHSYVIYLSALVVFAALMLFSARKSDKIRVYETLRPISPDRFEIEK